MQNLRHLGYDDVIDKTKGLPLEYARLALEELAKFHALSRAYMRGHPGGMEEGIKANKDFVTDLIFVNPNERTREMWRPMPKNIRDLTEAVASVVRDPGAKDWLDMLDRFDREEGILSRRDSCFAPKEGGFNVICHGDFWFNNMIFK